MYIIYVNKPYISYFRSALDFIVISFIFKKSKINFFAAYIYVDTVWVLYTTSPSFDSTNVRSSL